MYWCLGIGLFFILVGISSIFSDFSAFLGGLIIGCILLLIGLLIAKKKKPQFFPLIKEKKFLEAFKLLIQKESSFAPSVISSGALTPSSYSGLERKYHYTDVNIVVKWEYGGQYGQSCESLGIKRGDTVRLCKPSERADSPNDIAICWNKIEIGFMKANRLKDMVHDWRTANLPILTVVSSVGGEEKITIEFAFYGSPNK